MPAEVEHTNQTQDKHHVQHVQQEVTTQVQQILDVRLVKPDITVQVELTTLNVQWEDIEHQLQESN